MGRGTTNTELRGYPRSGDVIAANHCRKTIRILGIHCFGDQASEIIHIGQAIMAQQGSANTLLYFVNTTFNYPTMAEAYRVAALNGINRVFPDPQQGFPS